MREYLNDKSKLGEFAMRAVRSYGNKRNDHVSNISFSTVIILLTVHCHSFNILILFLDMMSFGLRGPSAITWVRGKVERSCQLMELGKYKLFQLQ